MSEQPEKPAKAPVKKHKGIVFYWVNLILLVIIVITLNYISFSEYYRRDLTQDQRFDASSMTVNLLTKSDLIKDRKTPIKMIFAFQRNTPNYTRMRALLEEYERYSDNKIEVECIDPLRQPNRAREIALLYDVEFKQNQMIIDAREDTTRSVKSLEDKDSGYLHVRRINGNDFVVYEKGTTKAVALQMEDIVTAQLISAIEGTPRKMYMAADKSSFSAEEISNPDSIFSTLNRACLMLNIQLVPIRLSAIDAIPADAAGLMLIGPQYDLTAKEQQMILDYWNKPSSGMFIALDPHTTDNANLYRFLRLNGLMPQNDRILLKDRKKAYYEINGLFMPGMTWMNDFATKSTALEGESISILLQEDYQLEAKRIKHHPLLAATEEYYGETKYMNLNPQFDPEEDNPGPLVLATAVERGNTSDINLSKETSRMIVMGNIEMLSPGTIKQEQRDFIRAGLSWITDREELSGLGSNHDLTIKLNLDTNAVSIFQMMATIILPILSFLIGLIIWNTRRH